MAAFSSPIVGAQDADVLQEMEEWAKVRIPVQLTAMASGMITSQNLTADRLELAAGMLAVATEFGPDSLPAWQKQLQLATAMRDDIEGAEQLERESIDVIVRLEPGNKVARLRQILLSIADRETAEGRVEAYNSFLTPEAVKAIGPMMAGRLAFDLALLERRTGDTEAYIQAIARSVELDPSYPPSVSSAAGFFRMLSDNTEVEVELLIAAVTADPFDATLMRALGKLLLRHGAYTNAAKILALSLPMTNSSSAAGRSLIEDYAIALWGAGNVDKAIDFLAKKQRDRVADLLSVMRDRGSQINRHAFLQEAPMPLPELALLKAVIMSDSLDSTVGEESQEILLQSFVFQSELFKQDIAAARENNNTNQEGTMAAGLASLSADEAWARLWCGLDVKTVPNLIDKASSNKMIDAGQRQVLLGWLAFREDRLEDARAILEPISENSPYAACGLAMVERAQGDLQSAAQLFLRIYTDVPGTALGLWSRGELSRILGLKVSPPEGAEELEKLAAGMPSSVSRIIESPKTALAISIAPLKKPLQYFEPLKVRVGIRNTTAIPLAIGAGCPIQPTLAIIPEITVAGIKIPPIQPIILSMERALSIPPKGELEIEYDLSATTLGKILNSVSLQGATIRLRCVVNYMIVQMNVTIGKFGEQATSLPIRINGGVETNNLPLDMNRRIKKVKKFDSVEDLAQLAILGQSLAVRSKWMDEQRDNVIELLITSFRKLGPMAKAWVLSQWAPLSEQLVRIQDIAVATESPVIFAVLLSSWTNNPGDAAIVAGLQSSNPLIREMANAAQNTAELFEATAQRQFDLVDEDP